MLLKIRLLINSFYYPVIALFMLCSVASVVGVATSRDGQYGYMEIGQRGIIVKEIGQLTDNGQATNESKEIKPSLIAAPAPYFWPAAGYVVFFGLFYFVVARLTEKEWKLYWKKHGRRK